MTEPITADPLTGCPPWCLHVGAGPHPEHESAEVGSGGADGLSARLVQQRDGSPEVQLSGAASGLDGLESFVAGLRGLLDQAHAAPAGLGFVDGLLRRAGISLVEAAEAADLDVSWLRAQRVGRQVLTVQEFDRLALAVTALASTHAAGR